MLVLVRGTPVELPPQEAQLLVRMGVAQYLEVADLPTETRYESSGTPTPPSPTVDTVSKPRKSSQGSSKKATK
jgi:hypothetical protein